MEVERQAKKKAEKELKKLQEAVEEERQRQKQIVLLLLAERKKLILKYVEERNKAEDLAQILGEEKARFDSMAEGLEEESQKALHIEAELEKQLAAFDTERAQLRAQLLREEKRSRDLEVLADKLQADVEHLKKQQAEAHQVAMFQAGLNQPNSPPRMGTLPANRNSVPSTATANSVQLTSKSVVPPLTPPRVASATGKSSLIHSSSTNLVTSVVLLIFFFLFSFFSSQQQQ